MKNLFFIPLFLIGSILTNSCQKDDIQVIEEEEGNAPVIESLSVKEELSGDFVNAEITYKVSDPDNDIKQIILRPTSLADNNPPKQLQELEGIIKVKGLRASVNIGLHWSYNFEVKDQKGHVVTKSIKFTN